jgi:hypothetical protein
LASFTDRWIQSSKESEIFQLEGRTHDFCCFEKFAHASALNNQLKNGRKSTIVLPVYIKYSWVGIWEFYADDSLLGRVWSQAQS